MLCFGNCRNFVFYIVDCRFSSFFVDVDFPQMLFVDVDRMGKKFVIYSLLDPPMYPPSNFLNTSKLLRIIFSGFQS